MADQGDHHQVTAASMPAAPLRRPPLRRFLYVVIWLTALAPPIAAVGYFFYANLLNPRVTLQMTGTYDGFYWDAAQLQIAYARLENQLMLYKIGVDSDYATGQLRYPVLQSKLNVMAASTRMLVEKPALAARQKEEIQKLDELLATL